MSLVLSVQTRPTVQPNGNAIVDTICRTAEHGDSYHHRSRARRAINECRTCKQPTKP
ncbi:transposase [Corynebacterium diphtheriae]|nr:transposase [Corynebacterium diphtheriae]